MLREQFTANQFGAASPPENVARILDDLLEQATSPSGAKLVAKQAMAYASAYPSDLKAILACAQILETAKVREGMLERWTDVHERFPDNLIALRFRIRWMMQARKAAEAVDLLEQRLPGVPVAFEHRLIKAELLHDAKSFAAADELFVSLLADFPDKAGGRIAYAKRLRQQGQLLRARDIIEPAAESVRPNSAARALVDEIRLAVSALSRTAGEELTEDADANALALKCAILRFENRNVRLLPDDSLGRVALITGSLGPGGAERQLSRLALNIEKARRSTGNIAGVTVNEPVQVVVQSHGPEKDNNFFLPELIAHSVITHEMDRMTPTPVKSLGIDDAELQALLSALPPRAIYGVTRLVTYFRDTNTDVASIWQDGACLIAALAALVAGVPRILLNMRGLPPSVRRHMFRPEYESMYRALARIPGVQFVSNSGAAARAYCEWLDLPEDRFTITYNGVAKLPAIGTAEDEQLWQDFVARTADATQTIGSVFRFHQDKRPLLWIRFAAEHLARNPQSRFLIVGHGHLLDKAIERARELGIVDRILFVGKSMHVGYWLAKLDVLVLMSRYEGLPNVLIEAQSIGLPVVTTPAGGAAECFVAGDTGYALTCAEDPCMLETSTLVSRLLATGERRRNMAETAQSFAEAKFSIPRMLERVVHVMVGRATGKQDNQAAPIERKS